MKKFLRFIGILILIVAVAWVILIFVEPKEETVERSITINAPKEMVLDQIVNFKNFAKWEPWYRRDTTTKMEYMGTDGQPGSSFHWTSSKVGEGTMTNAGVENGMMKYNLNIIKPWKNTADGWLKVEDAGSNQTKSNQTKVTWNIHMNHPAPWNAMMVFMNVGKMLGNDFESGLKNLKEYAEAHATMPASSDIAIKETQFPGHMYCGVRKTVTMADMNKFFMDTYGMLDQALQNRTSGPASGLYWSWDTVKHESDVAAVFPVSDTSKPVKGATFFNIPASGACMVALNGSYDGMMNAHSALRNYCVSKKMKVKAIIEEYIIGPRQEKDASKWVTNIYYLCDMPMNDNANMKK